MNDATAYRRPIVTLSGNGETITLDGVGERFTLKPGMTGTGLPPENLDLAALPTGGALLQHRRWTERTILIPLDVEAPTYGGIEHARRRLEKVCTAARVEITMTTPEGTRTTYGVLKDGLEGDFSWAKNRRSQPIALTFVCPDPFFYGEERRVRFAVETARKPLITGIAGDYRRYNLAVNPGMEEELAEHGSNSFWVFDADAQEVMFDPLERVSGRRSLKVTARPGGGVPHVCPAWTRAENRSQAYAFMVKPTSGVTHIKVCNVVDYGDNINRWEQEVMHPVTAGVWQRIEHVFTGFPSNEWNTLHIQLWCQKGGKYVRAEAGEAIWIDELLIEPSAYAGEWFSYASEKPGRKYDVKRHYWRVQSVETVVPPTGAVPFFPARLSSSTIIGEHVCAIEGDAPAYGVATITGPGTDVLIQRGGKSLRIAGEVRKPITIDARPQVWDVYTEDGDIWDRVTGDLAVINPSPGVNTYSISMTGATATSNITLDYRETFQAGH